MDIAAGARRLEEKIAELFSVRIPFSEHLEKWEDAALPDKYDHNCFAYTAQPTEGEFRKAILYQKAKGASFLKLEGNEPLEEAFGLEAGVTLTMYLSDQESDWIINEGISLRTPELPELEELEVKHFGALYGEDFSARNVRRLYEKLDFHGAYLGERLAGACYSFSADGFTCIDGLIVDNGHRNRRIATTILDRIRKAHPDDVLILHADSGDTPKEMYAKLGFEIIDRLYEYICTDIRAFGISPTMH